ncbi:MAG: phosphatase PAP2 family protein [Dehalococcoidia bacterium]
MLRKRMADAHNGDAMQLAATVRRRLSLQRLSIRRDFPMIALWLLGWLAFAALATLAAAFSRFPADLWLAHRLQEIDAVAFVRAVDWAEDLADTPWGVAIWLGAVVALAALAKRWEALLLLVIAVGRLLNAGLKELVERPRPSPDLVLVRDDPSGFAFPSGHVAGAVFIYGLLFYLATVLIPNPLLRLLAQAACLYIIAFTALERVYVGAHWPSDTVGALLLGGLIVAAFIWVHRHLPAAQFGTD